MIFECHFVTAQGGNDLKPCIQTSNITTDGNRTQSGEPIQNYVTQTGTLVHTGSTSMVNSTKEHSVTNQGTFTPVQDDMILSNADIPKKQVCQSLSSHVVTQHSDVPLIPQRFNACKQIIGQNVVVKDDRGSVLQKPKESEITKSVSPSVSLAGKEVNRHACETLQRSVQKPLQCSETSSAQGVFSTSGKKRKLSVVSSEKLDRDVSTPAIVSTEEVGRGSSTSTQNTTELIKGSDISADQKMDEMKMCPTKKGKVTDIAVDNMKKGKQIMRRTGTRSSERLKSVAQKAQTLLPSTVADECVVSHDSVKKETSKRKTKNSTPVGISGTKGARWASPTNASEALVKCHGYSSDLSTFSNTASKHSPMKNKSGDANKSPNIGLLDSTHMKKGKNVQHRNSGDGTDGQSTRITRQSNSTPNNKGPSHSQIGKACVKGSDGKDDGIASAPTFHTWAVKQDVKAENDTTDYGEMWFSMMLQCMAYFCYQFKFCCM